MRTRWLSSGDSPTFFFDPVHVKSIASEVKKQLVEIDWELNHEDLQRLRKTVYAWSHRVVKQFKKFDAQMAAAIDLALGSKPLRSLSVPKGTEKVSSEACVEAPNDSYLLQARASFSVIFGYGHAAYLIQKPSHPDEEEYLQLLGLPLARRIQESVEQGLGWDMAEMSKKRLHTAVCTIYNLQPEKKYPYPLIPIR